MSLLQRFSPHAERRGPNLIRSATSAPSSLAPQPEDGASSSAMTSADSLSLNDGAPASPSGATRD